MPRSEICRDPKNVRCGRHCAKAADIPELDRRTRARVRLTLSVFGLNSQDRCKARRRVWKVLENAWKSPPDRASLDDYTRNGPYRFVAALFLQTMAEPPVPARGLPAS